MLLLLFYFRLVGYTLAIADLEQKVAHIFSDTSGYQ